MRLLFTSFVILCSGCSSIDTQWYLKAEEPFAAQIADGIEGLVYSTDEFKLQIWALSGRYRTMYGPALIPLIPDEPPVLNDSQIRLSLRVTPRNGVSLPARISLRDLAIESLLGKSRPDLASWYRASSSQRGEIGGTYNREEMPEFIATATGVELELAYFS